MLILRVLLTFGGFQLLSAVALGAAATKAPVYTDANSRLEQEINEASGPDPVKESQRSAERIRQAQLRLAYYKGQAAKATELQRARYQRQLEADRKADIEIQKIDAQTKKYKKDLAIAEFNKRRSEIALAYARAKTDRQKKHQQKIYQRKIAAERAGHN